MSSARNHPTTVGHTQHQEPVNSTTEPVTTPVVPLPEETTIHDALELMGDKGIVAAPVLDERGQPIGVLSRTSVREATQERVEGAIVEVNYYEGMSLSASGRSGVPPGSVDRITRGESDRNRFRR